VIIVYVLISSIISGIIGLFLGKIVIEKKFKNEEGDAIAQNKRIIEDAQKEYESIRNKAELEKSQLILETKTQLEKEANNAQIKIREREKRIVRREQRIGQTEGELKKRNRDIESKEGILSKKEESAQYNLDRSDKIFNDIKTQLEDISQLTQEEARVQLEEKVIDDARKSAETKLKQIEQDTDSQIDRMVKNIIITAIQRYASDYVSERTVSVVQLPNDDMKGRIIGREGRNIRVFEASTGVDVIIDDTPEAVILSCFNPVRREIARIALTRLVNDGRIHPTRIEEVVAKCEVELAESCKKIGEQAAFDMGLQRMHPELLFLLGSLKYRSSYGQNLLKHSIEVGQLAGMIASELGIGAKYARRAGLLHDVGKAVDHQEEGSHAAVGALIVKKYGESNRIIQAIASHHNEAKPTSLLDHIIQIANTLSAQRPGARKEFFSTYVKRLEELENLCKSFPGINKAYAVQAGKEIRVMVENRNTGDQGALVLAKEIATKIENHLAYPGQIKVNVIRETRSVNYAK
jgi:ribonucrease Y